MEAFEGRFYLLQSPRSDIAGLNTVRRKSLVCVKSLEQFCRSQEIVNDFLLWDVIEVTVWLEGADT